MSTLLIGLLLPLLGTMLGFSFLQSSFIMIFPFFLLFLVS